jgi:hypothetical protein
MEVIMRNQITAHIERNGMMSRLQSGFRSNHSTTTALIKITNDLLLASEEKLISIHVLLDFSKAFDSVDYQLLCQYKFSTSAVELIRSYLCGRMQWVWIGSQASAILPVASGVVQGSVLGPLLFSLFINDITSTIVSCRYHLYADDVQLYISCRPSDYVNCISRLNLDLDQILQWSLRNGLSINATKSQAMVVNPRLLQLDDACQISLDGNTIAFHQKVKNLGLIMNSKLTWDDQISKICRNVFFTLKRLWPMSQFTPIQTRQKLVTSLIVPQFLYCDVIFSKSSARLRERLKLAFNSCARYIYGISRYEHISSYTNRILGVPLDVYYSMRICCMINKIIKSGGPRYLFDELRFGQSSRLFNLLVPAHSLNARACSFFVQGTILWNNLPPAVKREGSMGKFRLECLSHLGRSASNSN